MNLRYASGYLVLLLHFAFIIGYIGYILYAQITQRYLNIVFCVLGGLVATSIVFDGCFLTQLEQYLWDDEDWKGLTYTAYKKFLGVETDLETLKYSFMIGVSLFYITFINRIRLHKNSVSGRYFDYVMSIK